MFVLLSGMFQETSPSSAYRLQPIGLIILAALAALAAFLVAIKMRRSGWLLSLCLGAFFVFALMPWAFQDRYSHYYIWTLGSQFTEGYVAAVMILITAPLLGLWGAGVAERRNWKRFVLRSPYLSVIPVVILTIALSILVPVAIQSKAPKGPKVPKGGILKYPKYGFQVTLPKGWKYTEMDFETVDEGMPFVLRLYLQDYHEGTDNDFPGVNIDLLNVLPNIIGTRGISPSYKDPKKNVSEFTSSDDCYGALSNILDEGVHREKDVIIDGRPAMHVFVPDQKRHYYFLFANQKLYCFDFLMTSIYDKETDLYPKYHQQILDSFKLI